MEEFMKNAPRRSKNMIFNSINIKRSDQEITNIVFV